MERTERILVLSPAGRDGELAGGVLERAGFSVRACADMEDLAARVVEGAGAVLVAEEACRGQAGAHFEKVLLEQPTWSDLPVIVLTTGRPASRDQLRVLRTLEASHAVTFLERPVRVMTLVSSLRAALGSRRRQYQVRELVDRLAEDVARRDEFLALLGHELRNPLGAMRNAVELLRLEGGDPESDPVAMPTRILDRQVLHMTRLVDDLLDIARVTSGKLELRRDQVDLRDVARAALEMVAPLMQQRRHRLTVAFAEQPLWVHGDQVRLTQSVANLLTNAANYTPVGGHVSLDARQDSRSAEIVVQDDGEGMSKELLDRVFDAFVQRRRSGAGLGIGLTVAQRLAEMHGGELRGESDGEGRGSTFRLRLPVAEARERVAEADRSDSRGNGRPLRVLVVEDHVDQARALGMVVQRMGHEPCVVHFGREGLTVARDFQPDLVLLDIDLPDMDGCDVARRLRRDMSHESLVVAVTGLGRDQDRERTRAAGCDRHVTKPISRDVLCELFDAARI